MLRRLIATIGLLFASSLVQAGEAGHVVFVTGQVQVDNRQVSLGDAIQEGAEFVTGADGYIYMKTVDNGFLILRPGSRARIVTYHVDTKKPENTRVKLELLSGVARTISGQAVKKARQNFRFNTPVAAIGVRGTDFTVFTDQQTSRVAVISGGVVVSGFSAACGPEGGGPCEGGNSRELFAEQTGQLLQIQKGQDAPRLLRSNGNSPDLVAPPRNDEPVSKAAASTPHTATDVSLEAKKSSDILAGNQLPPAETPVTEPPTPPQPPIVEGPSTPPTENPVPRPPEVLWGRWQAVANLTPDSEFLAKIKGGAYAQYKIIGPYMIARVKDTEFVKPQEGRAEFALGSSEAFIRKPNQTAVAASVQDARLAVDFATSAFSTSLTVVAPDSTTVRVNAQGGVTAGGELISTAASSNANIRGYLGGAGANEAGYIFNTTNTTGPVAYGGTAWSR
ncbi:FecR family protein [Herbaspirillum sp. ST 5-3]|uniref:FecR family protein n=1 Tax=Oxalobacteraceae TaxID=75682 RepID=UPI0010A5901C|nr:FecR family protein [Herbaspirillum sp. ST 5-3]